MAVCVHSGTPTRRPRSAAGSSTGPSSRTKIAEWRNAREVNAGMATSESSPAARSEQYLASESSDASHSRWRVKRKKISSTGWCTQVSSTPSTGTAPEARSRTWS